MNMCKQLLVGNMVRCVKSLATKVDALNLTPEALRRKEAASASCPLMSTHAPCHTPSLHNKYKNNEKNIGLGQKALGLHVSGSTLW